MLLSLVVFGAIPFMAYHGEKGYRAHDERMQRQHAQESAAGYREAAEHQDGPPLGKPQP